LGTASGWEKDSVKESAWAESASEMETGLGSVKAWASAESGSALGSRMMWATG
jgi:hypothetical protein